MIVICHIFQDPGVGSSYLCLTCGAQDGSISAFTRVNNAEPLINLLSYILKKPVVDIHMNSDVVCCKCYKKFETIERLFCKCVELCRDTIQNFSKAQKLFMKTNPSEVLDPSIDDCLVVVNGVDLKVNENGIIARALSVAPMKKVIKKNEFKPERKFKCQVCGKTFQAYSHRVEHMLIHIKEKSFKCDVCDYHTSTKSNLVKHKQQHTKECICSICSKKLCSKFSLKEHMKIHNCDKTHQCGYCEKTFLRRRDKRIHEKIHSVVGFELQCKACPKSFALKSRLERHMLIHQKEKQFVCPICNKKFVRKDDLKCHGRIHTGEKPYACKECGKQFRYLSNCRNHMKIHMKELNIPLYNCRPCNISFSSESKYNNHLKTRNHKKKLSEPGCNNIEHVYCDGCKMSFSLTDYALHKTVCIDSIQREETIDDHLRCSVCCVTFDSVDQLSAHTLTSHVEQDILTQNTDTGIIISSVDVRDDIVSAAPLERLTVTEEGVNVMVPVDADDSSSLQIPFMQRSASATAAAFLPDTNPVAAASTSSTILPVHLESKASSMVPSDEEDGTVLREMTGDSGNISVYVVTQ